MNSTTAQRRRWNFAR